MAMLRIHNAMEGWLHNIGLIHLVIYFALLVACKEDNRPTMAHRHRNADIKDNIEVPTDPPMASGRSGNGKTEMLPSLSSLLGRKWSDVGRQYEDHGVAHVSQLAPNGHTIFVRFSDPAKRFGNVGLWATRGIIDWVNAGSENALRPYFSTVVGIIQPGVSIADIEKQHGKPIYAQYGKEGLMTKGWRIGDIIAFATVNGKDSDPTAVSVLAYHVKHVPDEDRLHLRPGITLKELAEGREYIEKWPPQ